MAAQKFTTAQEALDGLARLFDAIPSTQRGRKVQTLLALTRYISDRRDPKPPRAKPRTAR